MAKGNKKIAVNTVFVMLRLLVVGIIELWLVKLSLKALGIDNYGLYTVVGGIVTIMNVINTAMTTTTYRYIAVELGKTKISKPNEIFNLNLEIYAFLCFLFLVIAGPLGIWYINNYLNVSINLIPTARIVFLISLVTTIISMLFIPYQGVLIAMENFKIKIIAEVLWSATKVVGVILMIKGDSHSLILYTIVMLVAVLVRASVNIIYCSQYYNSIVKLRFYKNWKLCREMLFFNNWILLGAAVSVYKSNGVAIILNYYFGTAINAAYAVADRVYASVNMFSENLNTAAIPQIMKSYGAGNLKQSEKLVNYISKYSFFLLFCIAFPLYCQLPYILKLWLGEVPAYTLIFTRLIIIMCLLGGLGRGIPALVQATGKVKWFQITSASCNFLSLPIVLILYAKGAAPETVLIVFCIISGITSVLQLSLLHAIVKFDVKAMVMTSYVRALTVLVALIPVALISERFVVHDFKQFIVFLFCSEVYLFFAIYIFGLKKFERYKINNVIQNLWKSKIMHR